MTGVQTCALPILREHEAVEPVPGRGVPEIPPSVSIAGPAAPPSDGVEDEVSPGPVGPAERAADPRPRRRDPGFAGRTGTARRAGKQPQRFYNNIKKP